MKNKNSLYLFLTILLVILSTIGGYFLFKMYQESLLSANYVSSTIPKIELIPTDTIPQPIYEDAPIYSEIITPTIIETTPTATITATATPKPLLTPTAIISIAPTNSKGVIIYENKEDGFSVSYNSNLRQPHPDTEFSGNRYTFLNKSGNFAIHVSSSGKWSWTHPNRQFTSDLLVSGQNTFRYDIDTQTIIDFQSSDKNYTIQCIHNGLESLKTECQEFIASFKLL